MRFKKNKLAMRNLHIAPWVPLPPNIGGLETYLSWLCMGQVKEGDKVFIIGRTKAPLSHSSWYTVKGITYYIIPARNFPKHFPLNLRNPSTFLNLLTNTLSNIPLTLRIVTYIRPDVIFFYEVYQAPVSLLCRLLGYPTILGHFAFQPHWNPLIPHDKEVSLIYFIWYSILRCFSAVYTHVKSLLNSNGKIQNLYLLHHILGKRRAYFIPGCIDPSSFTNIKPDPEIEKIKEKGFFIVLCPRRLVPEKGVYYLLKAIPKILVNVTKDVMFLFTGEGPLLPFLKTEAVRLGVRNNVIFTGNIPYESVLRYMSSSDLVVVPSSGEETLGIVILEAYALKKPVVGTRFGGIPQVVEENRSGLLVQPANAEELADAIIKLLGSPCMREQLGKRGYELVQGRFNILKTVTKLRQVYSCLMTLEN